ncbi:MAG: CDP-glycerol glycerophosphotransferase family protein [Bacilli bacterium]|nr:CDP-glycerol glycerophosphotransferase family protein [Bacilli bacterium]
MASNASITNINASRKKNWLFNFFHKCVGHKRDKKLWIFSSYLGRYQDNSRYLFEYVSKNEKDIKAIYFVQNEELQKKLASENLNSVIIGSKEAKKIAKKAGVSFYTNGIDDFGEHIYNYRSYVVALWHGVGFKEMYYADRNFHDNIVKKIYRNFFSYVHRNLTVATSEYAFECFARDFRFKRSKAKYVINGQPRNDIFFDKKESKKDHKVMLYAPTYRKVEEQNINIKNVIDFFSSKEGLDLLKENNIKLYVRLHPVTENIEIKENDNVIDASKMDGQALLLDTDILITDYSSIATDFAITKKPVILYVPDYDEYIKSEPLFDEASQIYKHKDVSLSIDDLKKKIAHSSSSLADEFNKMLNTDLDGEYSKKLTNKLKEILKI